MSGGWERAMAGRRRRASGPADEISPDRALLGWAAGLGVGFVLGLSAAMAAVRRRGQASSFGGHADPARNPLEIPARGWRKILQRTITEFNDDQIPAVAGGVTFFALLSIFPALGAFAALYGLFADLTEARRQLASLSGLLPAGAVSVLEDQMTLLAMADHGRLGLTFAISFVVSLWASNAGVKALIGGLNIAYEEQERRNFIALNLVSLGFTIGAVIFTAAGVAAIAAVPQTLSLLGVADLVPFSLLRWPVLLLAVMGLLSLLYRYGPCRRRARWRWVTPGSGVAAIGWMAMSLLFSWYVANFGHYNRTYGSLGAVVGFMTWIWLSLIVVLLGAELNSEIESQTSADTTAGPPRPRGQRGAAVADHKP
jgi:membrane protein